MKTLFYFVLSLAVAVPAFAGVSISSPSSGETVSSPFTLYASAPTCSSQTVSTMGYSLDSSTDTTLVHSTEVNAQVSSGSGSHTVHVKAWGEQGAVCVTDVAVNVTTTVSSSIIPPGAISVSGIQTLGNWKATHDTGSSGGSASGSMSLVGSPSLSGHTREFVTKFTNSGDERYSATFGDDTSATNFLYDGWVYLNSSSSQIGNIEMDLNQVMPNGQTVLFGFQCDGWSGTWDYTANTGSPTAPKDTWLHSGAKCNPRTWQTYTWHHVQIQYSRNDSGYVTYQAVWLDGVEQTLNVTVRSAFALGWSPTLLTNFQVDGYGASGSPSVYLDDLTVYRW